MATVIQPHGGFQSNIKVSGHGSRASYELTVIDAASDAIAQAAIDLWIAAVPSVVVSGLLLVYDSNDLQHEECEVYRATITYVDPEAQEEEDESSELPQISFNISGETVHVTHGFSVRAAFPAGADAQTFYGAINVEKDTKGRLKVKGIDVEVPKLECTIDFKINQPNDGFAFARGLASAAHKTNILPWRGFQQGELQFKGARVRGKLLEKWDMQYSMLASPNILVPVNFGGGDTFCPKMGFDYFWVFSTPVVKNTTQGPLLVPQPTYAFSHQMYQEVSFAAVLGF